MKKVQISLLLATLLFTAQLSAQSSGTEDEIAESSESADRFLVRAGWTSLVFDESFDEGDTFVSGLEAGLTYVIDDALFDYADLGLTMNAGFMEKNSFSHILVAPRVTTRFDFGLENVEVYVGSEHQIAWKRYGIAIDCYSINCQPPTGELVYNHFF